MAPDPTPSPESDTDWMRILEIAFTIGFTAWYFYEIHAGFRIWVNGLVYRVTGEHHRRQVREREVRQMAWESWLVQQAMNEGGGDSLERRLGIA